MYKILLFGPQGSGKGTQGEILSEFLKIPLIVTGNIFRKHIKEKTELGNLAAIYINQGNLVPDEVTIKMIASRINEADCSGGFILDGYPRTQKQSDALEQITKITHVILVNISDEESIRRIAGRRACLHCGATYHIYHKPTLKPEICDICHNQLEQRADDHEGALKKRLELYHQQSEPILKLYQKQNILFNINGQQEIIQVATDIKKIFSNS